MISYVLLNYNSADITIECAENIRMQAGEKKIIIVDNKSTDNSKKLLVEKYEDSDDIDLVFSNDNLGFARGNNIGYERAKSYNPNFIIVMNNDMVIKSR